MVASAVIELREVPNGADVRRRPGRPRKIYPAVIAQTDYDAAVDTARQRHVEQDPLVADQADEIARMNALITAVAEEAAALAFEARQVERRGGDASRIRSRRVEALVRLGELVRQRRTTLAQAGILAPAVLVALRDLFLGLVRESAEPTLGADGALFVERLTGQMLALPLG